MANKDLFKSKTVSAPPTDTLNPAGGVAYSLTDKEALAQMAVTGTFGNTYYVDAEKQLEQVKALVDKVDTDFLAKLAIYSRKTGYMKDMPAFFAATLAKKNVKLLSKVFNKVVDDGRMLRNFVQIIRSGVTGRKSLGTAPKRLINDWLNSRSDEALFRDSVGNDPSIADVIKLSHPSPKDETRAAFFAYLTNRPAASDGKPLVESFTTEKGKKVTIHRYNPDNLPKVVKDFENFKKTLSSDIPDVEFRLLTALPLTTEHWTSIAKNAPWHMTRMNLNTFARHGVFKDESMVNLVANKLQDAEVIKKVKVFPYQLMAAFLNVDETVPTPITNALQQAMEHATQNVPTLEGNVVVAVDVSGSMGSAVTGSRGSASSKVRCVDVASLFASTILRKNPNARIIPFESNVVTGLTLNPFDSIMTNAQKLAAVGGGGTNCSAPLVQLNQENAKIDAFIFISDNMSWVETVGHQYYGYNQNNNQPTAVMTEWLKLKKRCPNAKLVNIDIQPYVSTQTDNKRSDILFCGGFDDKLFTVVSDFLKTDGNIKFVDVIEKVNLD